MTEQDDRQIRNALKQSFRPVDTELGRDLWPEIVRKLDARPIWVPWYDWVLVGMSVGLFISFPRLILLFAYHL